MATVELLGSEGLKRNFKVLVEVAEIKAKVSERLKEIGKTSRMDGFRPGRVPMPVLEKRYGEAVHGEAVEKAVEEATAKAIKDNNLRPASRPRVDLGEVEQGQPVSCTVTVEVLPDVKLADSAKIKLERNKAAAEVAEIEKALDRMAKSTVQPTPISADRKSKMGDVLLIDFDGSVDGEARPGMKANGYKIELGSKSFIDTFEDQLAGRSKGDDVLVKVTFPENYHAAELAGKAAEFKVKIHDILENPPVEMNDALAEKIGFKTIAELREKIQERMQSDLDQITREIMKRQLLDQLADTYTFEVPESMVDGEFEMIWAQFEEEKSRGMAGDDANKDEQSLRKEYRSIAERRVRLGLVLAEEGRLQDIKVEPQEMREALMAEVRNYPGQEKEVFEYFTKTPGAMDRLRAPILEEKVVDYLIGKASVVEKNISVDELRALPSKMEAESESRSAA